MNSSNLAQLIQQGFRATLGATVTLVEALQDSQKQTENISQIKSELNQLVSEWIAKGEITEQEGRYFVDNLLQRLNNSGSTSAPEENYATNSSQTAIQLDVQQLTAQLAAIRAELEELRRGSGPS